MLAHDLSGQTIAFGRMLRLRGDGPPVRFRTLLPLLAALGAAACAEVPIRGTVPAQRLDLSHVTLEPERARSMVNSYRASRGLRPLAIDANLTSAARRHSSDLSAHDRISHKGSDGSNPWQRVRQTGYSPQLAAENVGVGQRSFAEVMKGWMDSPGHNRNLLLPDATQMGVALVVNPASRNQTFWTLVLGKPRNPAIAAKPRS